MTHANQTNAEIIINFEHAEMHQVMGSSYI